VKPWIRNLCAEGNVPSALCFIAALCDKLPALMMPKGEETGILLS
jgi:hypothetical protein